MSYRTRFFQDFSYIIQLRQKGSRQSYVTLQYITTYSLHFFSDQYSEGFDWQLKFHSDWQIVKISAAYFIVRTDKIFKISPNDWHVQKDFNISANSFVSAHQKKNPDILAL